MTMRIAPVALAAVIFGFAGSGNAQQPAQPATPPQRDFSKTEIKTTDLGDNTYMLQGEGGNITSRRRRQRRHHGGFGICAAARQDQGGD